jgi:predicted MFS family arabinose efflux permease
MKDDGSLSASKSSNVRRILTAVSLVGFATALFARAVDPIIPPIAVDLHVPSESVALLSTAFSIPYALVQPALGPISDLWGKTRIVATCLLVLTCTSAAAALSSMFSVLLVSRVVAGMAAGGVFPVCLAIIGDLVPVAERQIAIGRYLAIVISGNFLGGALAGTTSDLIGWRGVFVLVGCCGVAGFGASLYGLQGPRLSARRQQSRPVLATFAAIFASPRARMCYSAVFLEGVAVLGLFPYVALMLVARGEKRAAIAGFVLSGFALGGIVYSVLVRVLVRRLSQARLMGLGGVIAAGGLLWAAWPASWQQMIANFAVIGFGFYMLHGCIQVQATEIAPDARGAAVSFHSFFFFLGQAIGPVLYGLGLAHGGLAPTLMVGAIVMAAVGLFCAAFLGDRRRFP